VSIFEDTNPRALKELLGEIHSRSAALPDFQRDFVWDPGATQELIVSIAYNYPAGSILRVRDTERAFAAREFEGAPRLDGYRHTFLVLDGQQRLTSLYQAFFGVGEHRYYLDLKALLAGADFEDAIFHARATTKWARDRESFDLQAQELLLPLSVLKGGAGTFSSWNRQVARRLPDEERVRLEDQLEEVEQRWIAAIDDYHFPVVTLSDSTTPEALCTIFETLNRTGVKLTVFELLTARFWPRGVNLRQLWDDAITANAILEEFEVDPYYVLQAISLAGRETPSCRRGEVLGLTARDIHDWWDRVVGGLVMSLRILRSDCNVVLPKWLPYTTMLLPLAAVLARLGPVKTPVAGSNREKIKQWFWCSVFGSAYESSANSQAAKDVTELLSWMAGGPAPDTVATFKFDPRTLRDVTPRQRSIYRGAICLILGSAGGARDFHTQAPITGQLMIDEGIDDHHIFPAAYLKRTYETPARIRDSVVNRTLIDRTTNQMINDRAPSEYLGDIRSTPGFPFDAVLASHLLPPGADSPLLADDFEGLLAWREAALWRAIQSVTGATSAADLETGEDAGG
jgi:hypothetical protein